ncbi:hypothetical protein QMM96_22190 [Citrobacter freundii]|uniref:hypothetical protein n=1 Tax=Citrobacter freundii TaxID=546 RepID=UPI002B24433B|nr:hypothetical protein [Citrobacter freundii]MEB2478142.1 hypothetical protein [Citrobacter freundii]
MTLFPKEYLTDQEDLDMHDWLVKQFDRNVDNAVQTISEKFIAERGEPSPEEWDELRKCATALSLREMPARLHIMRLYFLQSHHVGKLKEAAEAEPDNDYKALCHDAEETTRVALLRYLTEVEPLDDEQCDCEKCTAEREARENFEARTGLSLPDVSVFNVPKGMNKTGAYVMPTDDAGGVITQDAIPAAITHAFRCTSCRAVTEQADACACGCTELTPAVIVDLPTEQMEQMDKMKKAEAEHHAQPGNKVIH